MANQIQIKRSATTATPSTLAAGELAYSNAVGGSGVLFIGSTDGGLVVPIGGARTPGTLTANQALVANTTGGINRIYAANVDLSILNANGSPGTAGHILYSAGSGSNAYWASTGALGVNTDAQFVWTNTQSFSNIITFYGSILANTVNAVSYTTGGGYGTVTGGVTINSTAVAVGNSSVNAYVNSSVLYIGGNVVANSTGANNAFNLNGVAASGYQTTAGLSSNVATLTANNSTNFGGQSTSTWQGYITSNASAAYSNAMSDTLSRNGSYTGNNSFGGTNTVVSSNAFFNGSVVLGSSTSQNIAVVGLVNTAIVPSSNGTLDLGTNANRWGKLYLAGSTILLGNTTMSSTGDALSVNNVIVTANATVNNIIGTTTNISSNLSITASNVDATSATFRVKDVNVSGNLTVSGTLTTIDTVNLQVKDGMIKVADQNNLATSDNIDYGIYGTANTSGTIYYSGLYRDHGGSTATNPLFKLFTSTTEPTSIVDNTGVGYAQGSLQSYLIPYGTSGAFVANSTVVNITANSSLSVALVANSLTLTTALAASYGGTGQSSYTTGDLLYASGSTTLSKLAIPGSSANGQVLQIVNNLPAYGTLDGGTF
jgi:hypothetical protein